MANSIDARLARLEAAAAHGDPYTQAVQAAWEMEAARTRAASRVRLKIGHHLDAVGHPAVLSAQALLIDDTPAQADADMDTLKRWAATHPDACHPDEDIRSRITQKIDEMARRLEAHHEP